MQKKGFREKAQEGNIQGRIQDFKLGGEGAHLKKLRRAEGGANNFGVFRVKNNDFTDMSPHSDTLS
jgi:hypothetical protein